MASAIAILTATGNEALLSLSAGIGATIRWSNMLKLGPEARLERDPFPEHWDVFNAIAAGGPGGGRGRGAGGQGGRRAGLKVHESPLSRRYVHIATTAA